MTIDRDDSELAERVRDAVRATAFSAVPRSTTPPRFVPPPIGCARARIRRSWLAPVLAAAAVVALALALAVTAHHATRRSHPAVTHRSASSSITDPVDRGSMPSGSADIRKVSAAIAKRTLIVTVTMRAVPPALNQLIVAIDSDGRLSTGTPGGITFSKGCRPYRDDLGTDYIARWDAAYGDLDNGGELFTVTGRACPPTSRSSTEFTAVSAGRSYRFSIPLALLRPIGHEIRLVVAAADTHGHWDYAPNPGGPRLRVLVPPADR